MAATIEMAAAGGKPRQMGRVQANIYVANSYDLERVRRGEIAAEEVRRVPLVDVLVDTGATMLCLPRETIAALGLRLMEEVVVETAAGTHAARIFGNLILTVEGRSRTVDCLELPGGTRPLLGVFPLEILGIEVDLRNERLTLLPDNNKDTYLTIL